MNPKDIKNAEEKPLFSILIPTWNCLEFLKLCIRSIECNSTYRHEILIHVNDGSDGTLEWVREKGYKYTWSKENIGVCWSMNALRPLMSTEYAAYINDDMYVLPGWDEALYDEIKRQPDKLWYLASTLIEPEAKLRHYSDRVFGLTPDTFREEELLAAAESLKTEDWRGAVRPLTVVHRDIWDLIGGYSIEFSPGMASDQDFCAKLWMAGVRRFKGVGRSLVYHFKSISVNRIVKNDGNAQFLRKWGLTVRAFHKEILLLDRPWEERPALNPKTLGTELTRSGIKKLLKVFANPGAKQLWDDPDFDNPATTYPQTGKAE